MNSYNSKIVTAQEAIAKGIKSGDKIVFSHAAAFPHTLAQALADNYKKYKNIEAFHLITLGDHPLAKPGIEEHIRLRVSFLGANTRDCVNDGRGDFVPAFFHQVPRFLRSGKIGCDVAMIMVSKPNAEGFCSMGVSCDYSKPAADLAKVVIAEVNDQMPFVGGDNLIHVDKIDYVVEISRPIAQIPLPQIGEVEKGIGKNVAKLINDGATLQLGIGAIPDAVLLFLGDKKNLGLHTEMFSDGAVELIEKGVINGSQKELDKGIHMATFLMGSQKLYDFVNNNPQVELRPVDYVNDPCTIMKFDNMISVNSCIEIDLMGQVASEAMGSKQFSGVGGQVDYVRGASMAKNGISIMAMPSTARKGTVSRIVPLLPNGAIVTTSRCDVDYVVTEYGIAELKGKSLRERAQALISIAHPDFRSALEQEYEKRFHRK